MVRLKPDQPDWWRRPCSPTTVLIVKKFSLKDGTLGGTTLCSTACIVSLVSNEIPPCVKLDVADLPALRASKSPPATLHTDLSASTARADIVLVSEESVTMLELTIPSNSKEAIIKAKERKTNKSNYNLLIEDLEERGLSVTYQTLEIGSFGHYIYWILPFVFHTPSNLRTQKLNPESRKPPKLLLVAHIIFLFQETLPVGT